MHQIAEHKSRESVTPKERRSTLGLSQRCLRMHANLASVGRRAFALRRPPRALTSLSARIGTNEDEEDPDKRHDEGQITLANLPFCFSNYPAPRKQNRLQFSRISIELTGWLALIRKSLHKKN
jgi:hypothetical protein